MQRIHGAARCEHSFINKWACPFSKILDNLCLKITSISLDRASEITIATLWRYTNAIIIIIIIMPTSTKPQAEKLG